MSDLISVYLGTGRRKTAVARVRLKPGTGNITINGKELEVYCHSEDLVRLATASLVTAGLRHSVDAMVRVEGGGCYGQAVAIAHGMARALQSMDADLRPVLKKAGHLRRDPRMKERKKSGQPGARKRFQFSKR